MNFWQKIKKPIIGLAPMDGVTDEPTRQIQCQIAKPDLLYTEFISAEGYVKKPENFIKKLAFEENEKPIVVQIFGHDPDCFAQTITGLGKMGFSGIDINMGCPAKSVLQKGGGGALIGNYQLAEKIIKKSLLAIKKLEQAIPLSVKTRIGSGQVSTQDWFSFLSQFDLKEITIHGRSLKQGNSGTVNWPEIGLAAEIAQKKKIVCLGNGGIKSLKEAHQKCQEYSLSGVLIGQAALGNPWVFRDDYQPTKEEILKTIVKHGQLVEKFYGPKGFNRVLKHFGWYPRGFKGHKELKRLLLATKEVKQVIKIIDTLN